MDVGVTAEGEWGRNESFLLLAAGDGWRCRGVTSKSRGGNAGAFAGWRHERERLSVEASLRGDVSTDASAQLNPRAGVVWRGRAGDARLRLLRSSLQGAELLCPRQPAGPGGQPRSATRVGPGRRGGRRPYLDRSSPDVGRERLRPVVRGPDRFRLRHMPLVNRSSVRTSGIESRVAWQPHARLALSGELTWLRAEDSDGATLAPAAGALRWLPAHLHARREA